MSIFLRWKEEKPYSKNKFTLNLFSRISPYWYPTNVIGSSVYSIFDSYADQFSSLSIHSNTVFNDFSIYTSRVSSVSDIYNFKLYSNFSSLYNLSPLKNQSFDTYTLSSSLMSFRNNTSLLINSTFGATTKYGLEKLSQSFTGVSLQVREFVKKYEGWKLKFSTCSVLANGDNFYITQERILDDYNILPGSYIFSTSYSNHFSLTKLGVNTKVYSKKHYFSGIDTIIYGSESVELRNTLIPQLKSIIRGDQYINLSFSDKYYFYRPASSLITSSSTSIRNDYLCNTFPVRNYYVTGSVIELPVDCANYEWKYDWSVRSYNDAEYDMYIRYYPSSSIPDSVYFTQIDSDEEISYLPVSRDLYYSQYINNNSLGLLNLHSSSLNSMLRVYSYGNNHIYRRARNQRQISPFKSTLEDDLYYSGSLQYPSGFFKSFYFEMWVNGVDSTFVNSSVQLKLQNNNTSLFTDTISDLGYLVSISSISSTFSFQSSSGGVAKIASYPLTSYLQEAGNRWHYFAGTCSSGSVYLYIDDRLVSTGSIDSLSMTSGFSRFSIAGYNYAGVDEIVIHEGFLSPDLALEHFNMSKPRLSSNMVLASGSMCRYHQPMIRMKASGSSEIEWHEFSIKQIEETRRSLLDKYFIEYRDRAIPSPPDPYPPSILSQAYLTLGSTYLIDGNIEIPNLYLTLGSSYLIDGNIEVPNLYLTLGTSSVLGNTNIESGVEFTT